MFCVIPFHSGDIELAKDLLVWCRQLGGCKRHNCLLVCDAGCDYFQVSQVIKEAESVFLSVFTCSNSEPVSDWIKGANSLWCAAAEFCFNNKTGAWLWLEPDCVPLKSGWLEAISNEYINQGKVFMGNVYECHQNGLPKSVMSGVAVYPENTFSHPCYARVKSKPDRAFDVSISELFIPQVKQTYLIKHFWGQPNLSPTFVHAKFPDSPENAMLVRDIPPNSVIWHRCKDGTLIPLLRQKFGYASPPKTMIVVWPFCNKDAREAIRTMHWVCELNKYNFDIVISADRSTSQNYIDQVGQMASKAFRHVVINRYPDPKGGEWPPTIAFKYAAIYMSRSYNRPWLWMESDAIPLVSTWLDQLDLEYRRYNKPFAGPLVEGYGHMNGTGIYPANTPAMIPEAMNMTSTAWDVAMKPEMMKYFQNIGHLIFHAWVIRNGHFYPHGSGDMPSFPNQETVDKIPNGSVVFHRNKDLTLIDRLRERRK